MELEKNFGDPNIHLTSERKLRQLKQIKSVSEYATNFHRISASTNWNDAALSSQFYEGLKDHIKNNMASQERPERLDKLIDLALKLDNRLQERYLEYRSSNPNNTLRFINNQDIPKSTKTSYFEPMEVEATTFNTTTVFQKGPLSIEEKKRRELNGLCRFCASPNHDVSKCPKLSAKTSNISTTQTFNHNQENFNTQCQ